MRSLLLRHQMNEVNQRNQRLTWFLIIIYKIRFSFMPLVSKTHISHCVNDVMALSLCYYYNQESAFYFSVFFSLPFKVFKLILVNQRRLLINSMNTSNTTANNNVRNTNNSFETLAIAINKVKSTLKHIWFQSISLNCSTFHIFIYVSNEFYVNEPHCFEK